jgi:hypothetical protein
MRAWRNELTSKAAAFSLGAWLCLACSDDAVGPSASADAGTGRVELTWTIGGEQQASSCERFGADALNAVLMDEGYVVDRRQAPCADFSASMEAYVDDYVLSTTLIDSDGYRITERVVSISFDLLEGETELIEVDFPESSFLGGAGGADGEGGAGGGSGSEAAAGGGADSQTDAAGAGGVGGSGNGGQQQ